VLATPAGEEGGVLRNVLDLADGASERGHHVIVATPGQAADVRAVIEARGLSWVDLRRSTRVRADVWHLHVNNSLDTKLLALLARRRWASGARVLTEHLPRTWRTDPSLGIDPTLEHGRRKPGAERGKTAIKRLEFSLVDQVITPGTASADFLAERYNLPRAAVQTIHNGVPVPDVAPPPPPGDVMEVAVVGMLAHRKGHDVLLEACRLAQRPWNVTCVGEGPLRESLEQAAAGLDGRTVRFVGWRDDAAEAPLAAHVACIPSRMESFPYVALEAMACARPVVASDVDGLSEVVEHGRTGLLVPPEDGAALAAALDELAADPALRRRMGEASHARVRSTFRADEMVERTIEVYAALVERRS
jgi:glycosyltransferase involved in cell wall biosynthesis